MIIRKQLAGQVEYNNGYFAEIQTVGTEGIEKHLRLDQFQISVEDTTDTVEQFQLRFPVGMWLDVTTTTEVTPKNKLKSARRTAKK